MEIKQNYSWLKKIDKALLELDSIPLMRKPFPFNYEEFSNLIKQRFDLKDFSINPIQTKWQSIDEIKSSMGEKLVFTSCVLSPLEGNAFWIMDTDDVNKLSTSFLSKQTDISFQSPALQQGFYRYLLMNSLNDICNMNFLSDLSPKLVEDTQPLTDTALCFDFKINVNDTHVFARLAITPTFRKSWEEHFATNPPVYAEDVTSALNITLRAQIGQVALNYESFKKIKVGDFILLDKITYDPKLKKGQLKIILGNTLLFIGKLKSAKIKIIDFAQYYEEENDMEEDIENTPEEEKFEEKVEEEIEENIAVEESEAPPPSVSIQQMPINITVEVARFKLTLEKLMNMQPGNIIDLPVNPEQGVNLTVNGQKVAHGELVHLGDALGVRIIEMG